MEQESTYVGIDVAKAQVDVAVRPTGQRWVASYDETGVGELVSQVKGLSTALVLLEASGGLELPLVAAPWQLRRCPWSSSTLAKFETSPGPPVRWPRPTPWTRRSWPTSPTPFVPRCAL